MTALAYTTRAQEDLERLGEFLFETDPVAAVSTAGLVGDALEVLLRHPLIGRPVEPPYRELVISRGRTGYVALYSYDEDRDRILVHGIRHQREAGFDE